MLWCRAFALTALARGPCSAPQSVFDLVRGLTALSTGAMAQAADVIARGSPNAVDPDQKYFETRLNSIIR
jgi:hypothetical protein